LRKLFRVLILILLTGVVIGGVWVFSTYAVTRPAVRDAALVLHAALVENPEMTVEQAESILVELQHAGVINLKLLNDSIPGDHFGNPLCIELYVDSIQLRVYCMSPGIDGMPGTFDDAGFSYCSENYQMVFPVNVSNPPVYEDDIP